MFWDRDERVKMMSQSGWETCDMKMNGGVEEKSREEKILI